MKKNIFVLMILTAVLVNGFTQSFDKNVTEPSLKNKVNEVYLAVGTPSFMGYGSAVLKALFVGLGNAITNSEDSSKRTADFSVVGGYNHYFNENLAVGGTLGYERFDNVDFFSGSARVLAQYGFEHF